MARKLTFKPKIDTNHAHALTLRVDQLIASSASAFFTLILYLNCTYFFTLIFYLNCTFFYINCTIFKVQHRLTVLRVRGAFASTSTNARIQQFALNAPNEAVSVPTDRVTISASVRPAKPALVSPQCLHLPSPLPLFLFTIYQ